MPNRIPQRAFGSSGISLPILGMGGSAMADQFKTAYGVELPDYAARVSMVRSAFAQGIRFFDTARAYGESEAIMGEALQDVRSEAFLATKVIVHNPADVRASVEESLQNLRTDYIDLIQIHGPAIEVIGVQTAMQIHGELLKLRDEGICRMIGVTTHVAFREVLEMISTGGFEHVMLAYGYFSKGMDTMLSSANLEYRELCMSKAHDLGMAIVAMKVLGGWMLSHNGHNLLPDFPAHKMAAVPAAAIRWALRDDRVSMYNIGVSIATDIEQNVACFQRDPAFTDDDQRLLAEYCAELYESDSVKQMDVV